MKRLVAMANQIGRFFAPQRTDAAMAISNHISKFWDPQMRMAIIAYLENGGAGLDVVVEKAIRQLPDYGNSEAIRK